MELIAKFDDPIVAEEFVRKNPEISSHHPQGYKKGLIPDIEQVKLVIIVAPIIYKAFLSILDKIRASNATIIKIEKDMNDKIDILGEIQTIRAKGDDWEICGRRQTLSISKSCQVSLKETNNK